MGNQEAASTSCFLCGILLRGQCQAQVTKRQVKNMDDENDITDPDTSLSLNITDVHLHESEKEEMKNILGTKEPKKEASGRANQIEDSSRSSRNSKRAVKKKKRARRRRSTVYTRWGRTQCLASNHLVYSGRVATSHYTDTGGGSNYLCLPDGPSFTSPNNIFENQTAHLHPVKYGNVMNVFNLFPPSVMQTLSPALRNKSTPLLDFKDVPCAVCRVDGATTVLMMPARNRCPRGWDREYHGYLMSQKYDYGKSEFVCVDADARGIPNTRNPNGDAFLHLTEFKCRTNSPSCIRRGYHVNKALTCAVCTM